MKQTDPTDDVELSYPEEDSPEIDIPESYREAAYRVTELDKRGVIVEWMCADCGDPVEIAVLPEEREKPEEQKVWVCDSCIAVWLSTKE